MTNNTLNSLVRTLKAIPTKGRTAQQIKHLCEDILKAIGCKHVMFHDYEGERIILWDSTDCEFLEI